MTDRQPLFADDNGSKLNVVCFKWTRKEGTSLTKAYKSQHVNALKGMLERHVNQPFRLHCITDDQKGLDSGVRAIALPDGLRALPAQFPKIMLFSREMEDLVGESFLYMDLDVVVTGSMENILPGEDVEFKVLAKNFSPTIWQRLRSKKHRRQKGFYKQGVKFNTSLLYSRAGARVRVFDDFDKEKTARLRQYYMVPGSDQAWVYHCLGAGEQTWTKKDGVVSYGSELNRREKRELPSEVKLVFFGGDRKPWDRKVIEMSPWIEEHYPIDLL